MCAYDGCLTFLVCLTHASFHSGDYQFASLHDGSKLHTSISCGLMLAIESLKTLDMIACSHAHASFYVTDTRQTASRGRAQSPVRRRAQMCASFSIRVQEHMHSCTILLVGQHTSSLPARLGTRSSRSCSTCSSHVRASRSSLKGCRRVDTSDTDVT